MNKKWISIAACIMAAALCSGCAAASSRDTDSRASSSNMDGSSKPLVYTSFYPMYDFVHKIGGDLVEAHNLVPAGMEPHDWEPTPQDRVGLEKADMLVYSGAGFEHWVDTVTASLQNKQLLLVEASQGIELIGAAQEEKDSHGNYDPHVWLSPRNAKLQALAIKDALCKIDPAHKDDYEANYAVCATEFDVLDKEFTQTLTDLPCKEIVVAHDAFGYLCKDYKLTQISAKGFSPDSEPDPAKMGEVIAFCREYDVKVIFFEELTSPKVAQTIAKETGATTAVLNPIEGLSDEQLASGEDYFSVMRQNLQQLADALS